MLDLFGSNAFVRPFFDLLFVQDPGSAEYLAQRAEEAEVGVLREGMIKDIAAAAKNHLNATMLFDFRIGEKGIKPQE